MATMTDTLPALFDFSAYAGQSDRYLQVIKEFAAGNVFRSAVVEELVLDGDFYRRPLRPEDLDYLKFQKPVRSSTVSRLPSLASQRMLISLYELSSAQVPAGNESRLTQFREFASERNRRHATELLPFLEAYAFDYLRHASAPEESPGSHAAHIGTIYNEEYRFWIGLLNKLIANDYLQEGLRFILIQGWCLAPSKRRVIEAATATGRFEHWVEGTAPSLDSRLLGDDAFSRVASMLGVDRAQHSYWQFYLPTSLAKCNLLYALARRAERDFAMHGSLYVAQAEWLAFQAAIAQCCPHLITGMSKRKQEPQEHVERLLQQVQSAAQVVTRRHGDEAAAQLGQGIAAAGMLAERARWDLGEQMSWLSAIERYCAYADAIGRRIDNECPGIDRETFVEPRAMCSTTHVHNDHRLVTIETGVMHFWGNLDMRLEMHPGDKVLIPEGRLHGSTVLSEECTYHQPIIPDAWVRELLERPAAEQIAFPARMTQRV